MPATRTLALAALSAAGIALVAPGTCACNWGFVDRGTAGNFTLQIVPSVVPVPPSMALLGTGLLVLGAAMRRRRVG